MTKSDRIVIALYALWALASVGLALALRGLDSDNVTRLLVIAYLAANVGLHIARPRIAAHTSGFRFIATCTAHAFVIEATYMISRPVFPSLMVSRETPWLHVIGNTLIDFAFTGPAYVVIFYVVWRLIRHWPYRIAEYALLFSLGQALGDGNAFFSSNPAMLLLAPYVMLNYQAINVTPYLSIRPHLPSGTSRSVWKYVAPLVLLPAAYWVTGSCILYVGRAFGWV